MLDTLKRICDEGGRLVSVVYAIFEGDSLKGDLPFVVAMGFQFESIAVVFRARPDDDTIAAITGPLERLPDEVMADFSNAAPWSDCLGCHVGWAWQLTNQQGYGDGVRIEFAESNVVIELIVAGSAIGVFTVSGAAIVLL
jgi:hypothetical protein